MELCVPLLVAKSGWVERMRSANYQLIFLQIQLINGNPSRLVQTSIQTTKYQNTVDINLACLTVCSKFVT